MLLYAVIRTRPASAKDIGHLTSILSIISIDSSICSSTSCVGSEYYILYYNVCPAKANVFASHIYSCTYYFTFHNWLCLLYVFIHTLITQPAITDFICFTYLFTYQFPCQLQLTVFASHIYLFTKSSAYHNQLHLVPILISYWLVCLL